MSNTLQEQLVARPDGNAAAIAVIVREKTILLGLREYENAPTVWTAPGGSVDGQETFEQAVRRETEEETGIDDLAFRDYIGRVHAEDRDPLHIFFCRSGQNPKVKEPEKFNEWRWFSLADFAAGQPENYINEPLRTLIMDYFQKNGII